MMALFGGSSDKQQALIDNAAQQALQNLASQDGLTHFKWENFQAANPCR